MKTLYKYLGIFIMVISMNAKAQDFHSSMTKVDFVDSNSSLKFTTKLSTSDISSILNINPNTAAFEAEVKKYMNNNFSVSVNGSNKSITFTGSQVSGETVWVYFETESIPPIQTIKIKNSILISKFPKQLNLVNIYYKGQQKTMNFMKGKETQEVKF